jgi:hypothetical protein
MVNKRFNYNNYDWCEWHLKKLKDIDIRHCGHFKEIHRKPKKPKEDTIGYEMLQQLKGGKMIDRDDLAAIFKSPRKADYARYSLERAGYKIKIYYKLEE